MVNVILVFLLILLAFAFFVWVKRVEYRQERDERFRSLTNPNAEEAWDKHIKDVAQGNYNRGWFWNGQQWVQRNA